MISEKYKRNIMLEYIQMRLVEKETFFFQKNKIGKNK